jgi:hypothetical protein
MVISKFLANVKLSLENSSIDKHSTLFTMVTKPNTPAYCVPPSLMKKNGFFNLSNGPQGICVI